MTVSSTTTKSSHSGNGVLDTFAYAFKIFADDDLVVIIRTNSTGAEATKTKTTHYTVTGVGSASGGNVVFTSGNIPASGETVVIKRNLTLTQATDYVANDPFPADSHEDALDRLTMIAQQQQEVFDRAVVLPETDTASTTIPDSVTRASKYLAFNSSGDFIAAAGTADVTPISSAMEPVVEASTLAAGRTALLSGTNLSVNTSNTITTTNTNGDLTLTPNGTGTVIVSTDLDVDNININANTISSTNTNGDITLDPNGTGNVAIAGPITCGYIASTISDHTNLTLISTNADAAAGPRMEFKRNSASPADSDVCGEISFQAKNDADEYVVINNIKASIADVTDGTEDGLLKIRTMQNGTMVESISMYDYQTVFNGDGKDIDFRIDGSNAIGTHVFFMQASDGHIGIQTDTPQHPLDVRASFDGYMMQIFNDGNHVNRYGLKIQCGADSGNQVFAAFEDGDGNSHGSIQGSSGTVSYNTFTAGHPATLPSSDTAAGYPYGTLVETVGISYATNSSGDALRSAIIYNVQKSSSANSKSVLGAYASKDNVNDGQHIIYVLGDGHILCNNSGGNIAVGDGICTSATAGIGQKATASPSMIIGIAQEAVTFASGSETKLVAVQYGLQQFTPWS
jgi:hypothetical protein|tara:strand:+ start:12173 stop:14053 length:1881 start_codon:yes stop_codon:yes gene_type:complete